MKLTTLIVSLLVLILIQNINCHFFLLKEGTRKCFIEDLPKETLVVGKFDSDDITPIEGAYFGFERRKSADYTGNTTPFGMVVSVKDPNNRNLFHRDFSTESRFAFTSVLAGEHNICIGTNSSRWFGSGEIKVYLELTTGADANDYEEVKELEELTELEVLVRRLNDRVADIRNTQVYFKGRESEMRDTSETINSKVIWFSIIQTTILALSGLWQIRHLKAFFRQKKIE
eukprot:TRINITY_DN582_c0_g1_i1.p1 TRINITY_DN582_c0_g1~~TRINITY_DN582_c0_g1_i1.p1  ORF type:complete len:229 (-),score=77.65 TRINITY_DN582_c0_g1_i1:190-876(-)